MSNIKIESGVPIPPRKPQKHHYPFAEMKVGDSFLVSEFGNKDASRVRKIITATAWVFVRHTGGKRKFATRTTEAGIRVWRIA